MSRKCFCTERESVPHTGKVDHLAGGLNAAPETGKDDEPGGGQCQHQLPFEHARLLETLRLVQNVIAETRTSVL